jgi:hypothetical protein
MPAPIKIAPKMIEMIEMIGARRRSCGCSTALKPVVQSVIRKVLRAGNAVLGESNADMRE